MNETSLKSVPVGCRMSPLAQVQVDEIQALLREKGIDLPLQKIFIRTQGDRDKTLSLTLSPDNFFTDDIDRALLEHDVDLAIHSAKDLPRFLPKGLKIFALTRSVDESDVLAASAPLKDLKPGAKIGTSSVIRQKSLLDLRPDIVPVEIRGTIQERLALMDDGKCDGVIVAGAAMRRLGLTHLVKDVMPWETTPLQGQLAVVGRVEDAHWQKIFSAIDVRRSYGTVHLVGAGPGDPDLITVKAQKILSEADCVFYDYLVNPRLLICAPKAKHVCVGKRKGDHSLPQVELNRMIREAAFGGQRIVRLKGGDPFIFGRGADELEYLTAYHIPVEIIPGVSSATAIPSSIGVPLTARVSSSSVAFVSGHAEQEQAGRPQEINVPDAETLVFLMGLTKISQILEALQKKQWPDQTPVVVVSRGTTDQERTVSGTLATIAHLLQEARLEQPALIIVGKTVEFFEMYRQRRAVTLFTGLYPQLYSVFEPLVHVPTVEIVAAGVSSGRVNQLKTDLWRYDGLILTSGCGVKHFKNLLSDHGISTGGLSKLFVVSIGRETATAAEKHLRRPDAVAVDETSEGLLDVLFKSMEVKGKSFLFPRSALPNPTIKTEIERRGGCVDELVVYENRKPAKRHFPATFIDKVIFTSPSTVRHYLEDYGPIPPEWLILARGPLTARELEKFGYKSLQLM